MRQATNEELAYCAGVIDSDGSISIGCVKDPLGKKTTRYRPVIQLGQIQRTAVDLFAEIFGSSVFERINQAGSRSSFKCVRPMFHWSVSNRIAVEAIIRLRPFLRIKNRQADLAIAAGELIRSSIPMRRGKNGMLGRRSPDVVESLRVMHEQMKELNKWKEKIECASVA